MGNKPSGQPDSGRRTIAIRVTVLDSNKQPLKQQSLVRVTSQETGRVYFTITRGTEAIFSDVAPGKYLIEAGAAGYVAVHQQIDIPDLAHDFTETVYLGRDPAAVSLSLDDEKQLPSKARKDALKGIQALELGNFVEARKYLEAADRRYSSSASIKFLLGYLALQQKEEDRELEYLLAATKLDPHSLRAQNLLAQLYYQRGDYAHAAEAARGVVTRSADSVVARRVLAVSYLKLGEYEKARENSQWLVDHGGSQGASARLILGQALADLGQFKEAIPVLKAYLEGDPSSSVAPQVKDLISKLEQNVNAETGIADPALAAAMAANSRVGMPSDVDSEKPTVAAGVQCPANLLQKTGDPSKLLVQSVAQYSAIEHMVHENISPQGTPRNRETRQYNYVVSISEPSKDILHVQEYRDAGDLNMPDNITTTGLPVLAIAFHPLFRNDFEMNCEGLGEWNGKATWLVHFRQKDDKPSRLRSYVVNKNYYPVALKGRAWISADNFQIVDLETDLVRGVPEINLRTEHTSVDYGSVEFKKNRTDLWLPTSADLYVSLGNKRFHRSESFDHFMLFATDTNQTEKVPKSESNLSPVSNSGPQQQE
jgi:tetratricopeptide (TPR) repeat protein